MLRQAAAIGADLGRNSIRIAVVRSGGEIIASHNIELSVSQSRDYLAGMLIESVRTMRKEVASKGINPICVGISAKGFIDHKSGVVLGPGHGISGWENVPLASIINEATGLPAFVGNDANMMTIAEQRFGAARGFENIVFVALRSGIGGGIIINGKLYRGVNNAGGEIGQMIINYDDGVSSLGIKGSYEHLASASAVVRRYSEVTGNSRPVSCREIFELSYKNDPAALKVIDENAGIVGIGIANLITIFAPEMIILGGGMSLAHDSYIDKVRKSAFGNSLANCRAEVRVERASLGNDASIMGSAYYALIRLAGKKI